MPVHPRARGEHCREVGKAFGCHGSSPRTRGTQLAATDCRPGRTVHPRARGEHAVVATAAITLTGSSPRTRGTRGVHVRGRGQGRFIPAHAGNTPLSRSTLWGVPVHPRARGEHPLTVSRSRPRVGSSPRTRGTRQFPVFGFGQFRFIPAHAGNTLSYQHERPEQPVHPRARGEHTPDPARINATHGSSPRTRGTPLPSKQHDVVLRFIPAHAGNTRTGRTTSAIRPVHPRARGEHIFFLRMASASFGSSPRTRGTLFLELANIADEKN